MISVYDMTVCLPSTNLIIDVTLKNTPRVEGFFLPSNFPWIKDNRIFPASCFLYWSNKSVEMHFLAIDDELRVNNSSFVTLYTLNKFCIFDHTILQWIMHYSWFSTMLFLIWDFANICISQKNRNSKLAHLILKYKLFCAYTCMVLLIRGSE